MIALERKRKDENHSKYVLKMKENYDISKFPDTFKVGDIVAYYIGDLAKTNKKLHKRFIGPCKIIERIKLNKGQNPDERMEENVVRIQIINSNKTLACHTSMLKHYYPEGFTPLITQLQTEKAKQLAQQKQM